jgi:hypothetical protein
MADERWLLVLWYLRLQHMPESSNGRRRARCWRRWYLGGLSTSIQSSPAMADESWLLALLYPGPQHMPESSNG